MKSDSSFANENFQLESPSLCDLVMKGGITSGVVYPLAICELAKKYQFKNIGGTSAGAIAAAAAAAAEYGRQHNQGYGFVGISKIPEFLGENLGDLFQATPETQPIYQLFLKLLDIKSKRFKTIFQLTAAISQFKLWFLIGALPGLVLIAVYISFFTLPTSLLGIGCALILALIGGIILVIYRILTIILQDMVPNGFGICPGKTQKSTHKCTPKLALSDWLTQLLDDLSGVSKSNDISYHPLTFGDLWGSSNELEKKELRKINFEVMTSNLTFGEPLQLPSTMRTFFFDPIEFKKIFPNKIVDWMIQYSPKLFEWGGPELYQMPEAKDIPVVVATRMSLSFPILLTAIPLYAIDYQKKRDLGVVPEKCWFSDGGICSNFPVNFFDSMWPQWPTFAISLEPKDSNSLEVYLPKSQNSGLLPTWNVIKNIFQFFGAIFSTAQNWKDSTQTRLPGYRDRIVHIQLTPDEGGLNLNMPPKLIRKLSLKGQKAGQLLCSDFNWDTHRWVRYLSNTSVLESQLEEMKTSYENGINNDSLKKFLQEHLQEAKTKSYFVSKTWLKTAINMTDSLMGSHQLWFTKLFIEQDKIPNPKPELRVNPRHYSD